MALSLILDVAKRALLADQAAMGVVGHNIANVNTPGYTRQVADMSAEPALADPGSLPIGRGVRLDAVRQVLDPLVDRRLLAAGTDSAERDAVARQLETLAERLNDLSEPSLETLVTDFFDAADELARSPEDLSVRQGLLGAATALAGELNRRAQTVGALQQDADALLVEKAGVADAALEKIAGLNRAIVAQEASGEKANELRDERRQAIADLARTLGVTTLEDARGGLTVLGAGGLVLVTGATVVHHVAAQPDPANPAALPGNVLHTVGLVTASGTFVDVPAVFASGEIAGLTRVRDGDVATAAQRLDDLAGALATAVNGVQTGTGAVDLDGLSTAAVPLFAGTTAATIGVAIGDPRRIAAARSSQPGDNQNALALADLRSTPQGSPLSTTFSGWLTLETERLGGAAAQSKSAASASTLVATQLETQRSAISGVNLNEELTNLLALQRAFQAAARMVEVGDGLLAELIGLVR